MEAPLQLCLWLAFQVEGGIPLFSAAHRRWGEEVKKVEEQRLYEQNIYLNQAGVERQLTRYPGAEKQVVFSPDGRRLAYMAVRRDEFQIWRLDL